MTTDDKKNSEIEQTDNNNPTTDDNKTPEQTEIKEPELSTSEKALFDKMTDIFTQKIDEITTKYDKKVDELSKQITDKDAEIAKLRKVNSEILMNTDLSGKKNDVINYNEVEFEDVDWNPGAKALLDEVDKRLA